MKKVLMITDVRFWELCSGNRVRIAQLISYISKIVDLTVAFTGPTPYNINIYLKNTYGISFYALEPLKVLNPEEYQNKFSQFLLGKHFDHIVVEYLHNSYLLECLPEHWKGSIFLDAHDIISDRQASFLKFGFNDNMFTVNAEDELNIFAAYDKVILLTTTDFNKIGSLIGKNKVLLCPHAPTTHPHLVRPSVKNIVFVASSYLPNVYAINNFIHDCWPSLLAIYDQLNLLIYGTVCDFINDHGLKRIDIKGFCPNLPDIYKTADIVINPVSFGAGAKIKNIEALGYGVPLVTSSHGASGIESQAALSFVLADTAELVIKAISTLIENYDFRKTLSKNAYQFVKNEFSADNCFRSLKKALLR
ncbi:MULTISPECIES: glycosyltransferase [unclassified Mucilaginibacter]|uniref:glycosyltransferase n=1 Tax=unclassified Mucilaginibacter TaxID=2617802 RepID=UPI002AC9DE24|nr:MULTISPECIES: glycosyltransferase [unclassified Mucilaginibacter]MEB0280873.1 glycosyltransferase [Mucilaginibacter sp. 10B2]MEB0302746.1 glycosyltransferase [Mucilaginibacter sp. 5C4]WPX25644.1 glycosyltransferase [Mucilaginibacter sp. 5C4]